MEKKSVILIWVGVCLLVHVYFEAMLFIHENYEYSMGEMFFMTLLTFPLGVFLPYFWSIIFELLVGVSSLKSFLDGYFYPLNLIMWISYLVLGYVQYFVLVPKILRWIRIKKRS